MTNPPVDIAARGAQVTKRDVASRDFERHEGDWHEWSTDVSARQKDGSIWPGDSPRRLFVRLDADCLIAFTVVEALVTSENPGARELSGKQQRRLILSDDDAVWLRGALTKAIDAKAKFDGELAISPEERAERAWEALNVVEFPGFEDPNGLKNARWGFVAGYLAALKEVSNGSQ